MGLTISEEEIRELVRSGKIDDSFPYLKDATVMYTAIKENIELAKLVDSAVSNNIMFYISFDKTISHEDKKELFYHLIDKCTFSCSFLECLIDSEDYYLRLATKSIVAYILLCGMNHAFKEQERDLFDSLYETEYIYNSKYRIDYAKKSSIVLLNALKYNYHNVDYTFFDDEAFSSEVFNYIENNVGLDGLTNDLLKRFPVIKLFKLKKDFNYLFELREYEFTDEMISYLKSVDFDVNVIDEHIKKPDKTIGCLYSSKFILMLLVKDLDNIKYFKGSQVSYKLIDYLNQHNYCYRECDNEILLKDMTIYKTFIDNSDITILFRKNIELTKEQIELLIEKIVSDNINFSLIENKYLLENSFFVNELVNKYGIPNPYDIENKYLISSLARSLEVLDKFFSVNDIKIIIREIIKSDYHLDMMNILNNIDINKLKDIYERLYVKVNKFNTNFNFYFFIKVMEYFSNNLSLVSELNSNEINDEILENLSLVINNNDSVSYKELIDYKNIYVKKLSETDLSDKEKLYRLLVNGDSQSVEFFLENVLDIPQLLYLQLEFSSDSLEYQLLESYIDMANLLKSVQNDSVKLDSLFIEMKSKFPNSLFDLKVMKENVLRLFARMYQALGLDREELRKKGKYSTINGKEVIDLTGEKFFIYLHTEEFSNNYDFTEAYERYRIVFPKNYICTMIGSDLEYNDINRKGMQVFELKNPTSLLDFGNRDLSIKHTKKPLFRSLPRFVNPIDMGLLGKTGFVGTDNEFDFLRVDDQNQSFVPSFTVVKTKDEAERKTLYGQNVIIFDANKHKEILKEEFVVLCENVELLDYKNIYRLIGLSEMFELDENIINRIIDRIKDLSHKEQIILYDALEKYQIGVKLQRKVK